VVSAGNLGAFDGADANGTRMLAFDDSTLFCYSKVAILAKRTR
jgi:hypothetical protein